jgi:hypothetical protein
VCLVSLGVVSESKLVKQPPTSLVIILDGSLESLINFINVVLLMSDQNRAACWSSNELAE